MLIRLGYDRLEGWAPLEVLDQLPALGANMAAIESIDFEELEQRGQQSDRPSPVVLDVRSAADYDSRHIPAAQNIPYTRLRARIAEVGDDRTIYVHCQSGARASVAAAFLARTGRRVVHVDGAFEASRHLAHAERH
jgi:hydroxyacylglutathione hydrolase